MQFEKKLAPNIFDKEKLWEHTNLLKVRIKAKKIHCALEFNQSQLLKPYVEIKTQKRIKAEKNCYKERKALYKLMNNAVYAKTMKNVRNRIDVELVSNRKDYLKWTSKPRYM